MTYLHKIDSYLDFGSVESKDPYATFGSKLAKMATGAGVAAVAIVSWKLVAIGALAYSAYQGGRYVHGRYFQGHQVRRDAAAAAAPQENPLQNPINAGHDAHGDGQQERNQPVHEEVDVIGGLREKQREFGKTRAIRNVFEIIISHPEVNEKGRDYHWVGKMIKRHAPWAKRTFGLSLYAVKGYRYFKSCLPPNEQDSVPG